MMSDGLQAVGGHRRGDGRLIFTETAVELCRREFPGSWGLTTVSERVGQAVEWTQDEWKDWERAMKAVGDPLARLGVDRLGFNLRFHRRSLAREKLIKQVAIAAAGVFLGLWLSSVLPLSAVLP